MPYDLPMRRLYWRVTFTATLILFPLALIIFAFSGCDLRKRSEKKACRGGKVEQCLYVGKYYEDKGAGLIPFLLSYNDDSIAYYTRACKLRSDVGCERMLHQLRHGPDQAKNLSTPITDIADALISSCADGVQTACDQLYAFLDEGDWVAARSVLAFQRGCDANNSEACYRLALMHENNLGGRKNVLEDVLVLHEKACKGGIQKACKHADDYRAELAKRNAQEAQGSGAAGSSAAGSDAAGGAAGSSP